MNNLLRTIGSIFLALVSFSAQAAGDVIAPKEASTLSSEKKAIIIDVREDDEWNAGHIAGAVHIPLNQINNRLAELQPYKDGTIITQCRSGRRSMKALELLKVAGFNKVYNMDGGLQAWEQQGLSIQK